MEEGEDSDQAALREAYEEAGVRGTILAYLGLFEVRSTAYLSLYEVKSMAYLGLFEVRNAACPSLIAVSNAPAS